MVNVDFNLFTHFSEKFSLSTDKVILNTEHEQQYTFSDIDKTSAQIANYFIELGAKVGDRISSQIEKSPEGLCLYFACLRAGLVFHPLNTAYNSSELEYFFGNAEPFAIVCDENNITLIESSLNQCGCVKILTLNGDGDGSLIDNSSHCSTKFETVPRAEDDFAALLYSSGTTGVPKGIMISHGNLLGNAKSLVKAWGFTHNDTLLHCLPTFHVHGLFISLGCTLLSGASIRWLSAFNINNVIKYLPGSTVMMGVPTYYTRLLDDENFTGQVSHNIRLFISGSAPLREDTFALFEQRTGHRILERYGMTETNVNTSNPLKGERRAGTVGLPLHGVEIRVVDDDNKTLKTGTIGNIQIRGSNVFSGYWHLPEKTAESFTSDQYFDTGDKGKIDEDGYLAIVGRSKDLIISGGLNIYPKEVEIVIDELSGVKESAVIGVAHSDFGEAVVAMIVEEQKGSLNEDQIRSLMKAKVANFKVPKRVIFIDDLPRNSMGKVQKNILRDQYEDLAQ
ncbi:MAG: AMP-binding protein [Gammaproteobacteria bacterium]|nr:AMP-binding protein [Gammaproteobacteria bacterium]